MYVDAHMHIWNLRAGGYSWLTPESGPLFRSFSMDEVDPQLAEVGIQGTVLVQADDSHADTDFMLRTGEQWPRVAGVVGWVPLDRPGEAAQRLDMHGRGSLLVGVRHLIHNEEDADWVVRRSVQEGLALLSERNMTFDLVATCERHLQHANTLARNHPDLRMVIDHLGSPPIGGQSWRSWARLIEQAAAHPNVYAKLSGLHTIDESDPSNLSRLSPSVNHALSVFGAERVMFGSDWPVSTSAGTYESIWRSAMWLLESLDDVGRRYVMGAAAAEFYSLRLPVGGAGSP